MHYLKINTIYTKQCTKHKQVLSNHLPIESDHDDFSFEMLQIPNGGPQKPRYIPPSFDGHLNKNKKKIIFIVDNTFQ